MAWKFFTSTGAVKYGSTFRLATTVAGLGAGSDGAYGLIRAGSTPYNLVPVTYDATYGKWVSAPHSYVRGLDSGETTASTVYVNSALRIYVPGFKAIYDAGLRPFVRVTAVMSNNTGGDGCSVQAIVGEFNDGDTASPAITNAVTTDPTLTVTSTTSTFKASDWLGFGAWGTAPAKAHGLVLLNFKAVTGGTASLLQHTMQLRWEA